MNFSYFLIKDEILNSSRDTYTFMTVLIHFLNIFYYCKAIENFCFM